MNGGKPHKSRKRDSALDELSNLPSLVIDQILCRLPIRDAIKTSVLSSKWRLRWSTMSDLVFHDEPVKFIDRVLLLHTGAISKFKLDRRKPIKRTHLDSWILHLSRCHVQEFKLRICNITSYKLHSSLFSFQDLVHLDPYGCHLKLPSTFSGFKKLKSLKLDGLDMAQDAFETLISSCPILERLTLWFIHSFRHLNIDAPNLLKIEISGCFDDMNLINCSNLEEVSIRGSITGDAIERIKSRDSSNLLKFFSSLPRIKRLDIESEFLKYLGVGDIPRQLPNPCTDLGYLWLDICNDDYVECSVALCLLRSSPNLQELNIEFQKSPEGNEFTFCPEGNEFTFWESSKHANCSFNKLQTVDIYVEELIKNNLELIGLILSASPVLKKMTIRTCSEKQALQLAKEMLRFQRASTKAEVVFLDW